MSSVVKTKDSQWLQIEICQDYLAQNCSQHNGCKYAHPPEHIETENGKVVACYDSFKGRCTREICKYYHPTSQLMEQLLMKGRNNLARNSSDNQQFLVPFMTPSEIPSNYRGLQLRSPESSLKRSAETSEFSLESLYSTIMCKRLAVERIQLPSLAYQPIFQFPTPSEPSSVIPLNASFVNYTDSNGQLLDRLVVCQDFNRKLCTRFNCKFVHLIDPKKHEITEHRVQVCRDHANGICRRQQCKYYHIPISLPPASEMVPHT